MMAGGDFLAGGVRRLARIGIDAAFPLRCWQCESLYARQGDTGRADPDVGPFRFDRLMGLFLCPQCTGGYEAVRSPLCITCGLPYRTEHGEDHVCPDCLSHPKKFESARAAGPYLQPLKTLIHHYKYQGRAELAFPLGRLLWDALIRFYDPQAFDLIVPVPLHWLRQYRRGFNQAALLVREWHRLADGQGIDWKPPSVSTGALYRCRRTLAQTGLGKRQRAVNLKNAFVVPRAGDVEGKRILLVDDVMTTGATAAECIKVLKRSGAASVKVLSVARAV